MPTPFSAAEQGAHFLNRPSHGRPQAPVRSPAAWLPPDLGAPANWREDLTERQAAALLHMAEGLAACARAPADIEPGDVCLPGLAPAISAWRNEVFNGRGFVLLRGLRIDGVSRETLTWLMIGLGMQFGRLGLQNPQGDLIGEVRNTGAAQRDPNARNYATDREFRFHCDAADVLGLLCVSPAARGGRSRIASSVSVFNALAARRPDLARRLFEPMLLDLRNEQAPGQPGFGEVTPCAYADGELRTFYISDYFRSVVRHPGVVLSGVENELFDLYEALADEAAIDFELEPGDIQIMNNHVLLHARTAFEDSPQRTRLLLRFLASAPR